MFGELDRVFQKGRSSRVIWPNESSEPLDTIGIGQVDRDVAGALQFARLAARQGDHLASSHTAEMPQGGVSHEPGRARDDNLFDGHSHVLRRDLSGPH